MAPDLKLLQLLTPEIRVLIWAHSGPLDLQTPGLATMDYLLNGLVTGHVTSNADEPLHHVIFSHPQYGETFWVAYVNTAQVKAAAFLPSLTVLLPTSIPEHVALYAHGDIGAEWTSSLAKTFSRIETLPIQ